jgi:hypothetical protein
MLLMVALVFDANFSFAQSDWYKNNSISNFHPTRYLSIGFSSQNLKAITSMFGHTFLVFHNNERPTPADHVIEFRGVMGSHLFDYARAVLGTLDGKFELNNFIYKMREYHFDGRDIWIYRVNLNENEIEKLVNYFKSNLNAKFHYSFLNQNCSFFLNKAILETLNKEDNFSLATIPIQSVRRLKEMDIVSKDFIFIPSEFNDLNFQIDKIPLIQKEKLYAFFHKNRDEFEPQSKSERKIFSGLLNIKVRTESSMERRNELFKIKKHSLVDDNKKMMFNLENPLDHPGDSYFAIGVNPLSKTSIRVSARGAQRSYISNLKDAYRFSRLEIVRPVIRVTQEKLNLDEFNLFTFESVNQKNFFFNNTDKFFDLSFYDWENIDHDVDERVLRLGIGKSFFMNDFSFSTFPYLGVKYLVDENDAQFISDQGLRFLLQYNPSNKFTGRFLLTRYLLSSLSFNTIYQIEMSYRIEKNYSAFLRGDSSTVSHSKNLFAEFGLAYLF